MSWERRKGGGLYYTRSRKISGHVVREYIGGGMVGQLAAMMDAERRAEREARAEAWRTERTRLEAADAPVAVLCEVAEALARGSLMLAGYHRHHRGEWRRRRGEGTKHSGVSSPWPDR